MDFLGLTLPEASYLFLGLGIQDVLRHSSLAILPTLIMVATTVFMMVRHHGQEKHGRIVAGYLVTCLLLEGLFWPETLIVSSGTPTTDASQVASYIAQRDGEADVVTAQDTGLVWPSMRGPAHVPTAYYLVLRMFTGMWLTYARTLNSQVHRPFPSLLPYQWLLGTELTADVRGAVDDWVYNCYVPVMTDLLGGQTATTSDDLSPWGNGKVSTALDARSVVPGAQTGLNWITAPGTAQDQAQVTCWAYLGAIESRAQARLFEAQSPRGTPLLQVFQEELGLDAVQQGRFVIYQEMLRAFERVPAPSLLGQYLKVRGLGVTGSALQGAMRGSAGGWYGAIIGAITGTISGVNGEFQRYVEGLSWLVRTALFVTWYAPYVLGWLDAIVIGFFPLVLLLGMVFRRTWQTLLAYFGLLAFLTSSPVWWALSDQCATLAASLPPQIGTGYEASVVSFLASGMWYTSIVALTVLTIPLGFSLVLGILTSYAAYRGVTTLIRGG